MIADEKILLTKYLWQETKDRVKTVLDGNDCHRFQEAAYNHLATINIDEHIASIMGEFTYIYYRIWNYTGSSAVYSQLYLIRDSNGATFSLTSTEGLKAVLYNYDFTADKNNYSTTTKGDIRSSGRVTKDAPLEVLYKFKTVPGLNQLTYIYESYDIYLLPSWFSLSDFEPYVTPAFYSKMTELGVIK